MWQHSCHSQQRCLQQRHEEDMRRMGKEASGVGLQADTHASKGTGHTGHTGHTPATMMSPALTRRLYTSAVSAESVASTKCGKQPSCMGQSK
eukprot:359937-Chlamydomonas_euryale.AAC.7